MGYYTTFSLSTKDSEGNYEDRDYLKQDWLDVTENKFSGTDFEELAEGYLNSKWYDYEGDMIKLSEKHPDKLFILEGNGEDYEDIWKHYFKNGKGKLCRGEIVFEKFDENKLQ